MEMVETPRHLSFCTHAILQDDIMIVTDATCDDRFVDNPHVTSENGIRFYAGVPLVTGDGLPLGALCVLDVVPRSLSGDQIDALILLAQQVIAKMELRRRNLVLEAQIAENELSQARLEQANDELRALSLTDALTSLPNRRWFDESLEQEFAHALRYGTELSVIVIDVDNFKQLNDRFGHADGDRALQTVARLLRDNVRSCDLPARYGGEEFVVLMPSCDCGDACQIAERVRSAIAASAHAPWKVTVSVGVASFYRGVTASGLLECADQALYRAKRGGKNRVVAHTLA